VALTEIEIAIDASVLPDDVAAFLGEADRRVSQFAWNSPVRATAFVPSNFETVFRALRAINEMNLAPGHSFCEWGSGLGVVASLAAMLEFSACGIEIEKDLVEASRELVDHFDLPVAFVQGSFIPSGAESCIEEAYAENSPEFSWLVTDADDAYDDLGLNPDDFDVVFAYPWPGEEHVISNLFEEYAAEGALLLLFDQFNSVRLLRKVSKRSGGR